MIIKGSTMFYLVNLLKNEYFPEELPPCFNSDDFAFHCEDVSKIASETNNNAKFSVPAKFSGYKRGHSRRIFSVPNPYHYYLAANLLCVNSKKMFEIFANSGKSLTCPIKKKPSNDIPYYKKSMSIDDSKREISKLYGNNLYEIRLDISSCFESIYTHAISWAIHGKKEAKKNKSNKDLLGNKIDSAIRAMNSNQTNGILIGNSLSRIVSEIILCSVDKNIKTKIKDIDYYRYVDDYFIYVETTGNINDVINEFNIALKEYELNINESKLQINESPFVYGSPYIEEINSFANLKPYVFLNKLIIHYKEHKDISIMKYGLKILQIQDITGTEWKQMQSIIMNLWVRFPSLSNIFTKLFLANEKYIGKNALKNCINAIIDTNINLNNEQEIVWAVWVSKLFNIRLSQDQIRRIFQSENQFAIIILLDIMYKNDDYKSDYFKSLKKLIRDQLYEYDESIDGRKSNMLWSEFWLLAYEADKNKWLNIDPQKPFIPTERNEFFKKLKKLNIEFYNADYNYDLSKNNGRKINLTKEEFNKVAYKISKLKSNRNDQDIQDDSIESVLKYLESDLY